MDLRGKKLLVLAGSALHNKVVRAAKEMGVYTIVTDYLEDSPAKKLADESWMLSITDVDEIVKKCKEEKVDAVLNFCIDPAQKPYQQICEKLGFPCIGTKEQFDVLTDKKKFKEFCVSHNVDVIPDYTYDDIMNNDVEYPIFIKPTNSRGSRGQSICYNLEEAKKGIEFAKSESSDNGFLCEKYMGGKQDIASAFFVVNGEPYMVKFGNRHLGKIEDKMDKQVICTELPSEFSEVFEEKVSDRVKNMIKSLGVKFGPVFLQGFIDGSTIRYYDPAMRMPGGDYDLVLEHATGFSTVKSMINFAFTGDSSYCVGNPKNAYMLNGGIALLMSVSVKPGVMSKIVGLDDISNDKSVVYARQNFPEGTVIPDSGDVSQRVAAVGGYVKSREEEIDFINRFYDTFKVLDENGNDMIISKFDYSKKGKIC